MALIAAVAAAFPGCGGGASTADTVKQPRPYPWLKGPTREFLVPGGDNAIPTYGEEGSRSERAQATAVIAAWLHARAAKDWKRDCAYFSRVYSRALTKDAHGVTGGRVKSCPEALAYFKEAASGNYVDALSGSIDSLRVGEGQKANGEPGLLAFAQYHGTDGKDWIIPLEREGGKWRVAKAAPLQSQH